MENKYILWTPDLEVKIDIIDQHHKKIFEILNTLYDINLHEKYEKINEITKELKDYTNYHFGEEEKILKEHNYPAYLNQRDLHDKFRRVLVIYSDPKIANSQKELCTNLLFFVQKWFINHIKEVDKKSFVAVNEMNKKNTNQN
jgi:hemerythrin